jgi:hypothetical protein
MTQWQFPMVNCINQVKGGFECPVFELNRAFIQLGAGTQAVLIHLVPILSCISGKPEVAATFDSFVIIKALPLGSVLRGCLYILAGTDSLISQLSCSATSWHGGP